MSFRQPIEITKHPSSSRVYAFDFGAYGEIADDGQTLSSVDSLTATTGSGLTIGTASIDGSQVKVRLSDGNSGTHTLTCVVTTSGGDELVVVGKLKVTS